MSQTELLKSIRQINILTIVISVVVILLLTILFFIFGTIENKDLSEFLRSLIVNLIPVIITFLILYFLFRKINDIKVNQQNFVLANLISDMIFEKISNSQTEIIKQESKVELLNFIDVNWTQLIDKSVRLDIKVHYFNTWIRKHRDLFLSIFNRGGTIRLLLPNQKNDNLVSLITLRFPEYSKQQIIERIQGTIDQFVGILDDSSNKRAKLEVYIVDELGYYSGIRIDNQILVLSEYEHIRVLRRIESPGFIIKLKYYPDVDKWFEKEFSGLMGRAVETKKYDS